MTGPLVQPTGIDGTFTRGNYIGHWIDDKASGRTHYIKEVTGCPPSDGSGSLEILSKEEGETVLVDKVEHPAEDVFNNYCEPDWHQLAEEVLGDYLKNGVPFSSGLKTVGDNDRHIKHDVYLV